jgi:iron complex outermembrane receptor protein
LTRLPLLITLVLSLFAVPVHAFTSRLLDPSGKPVAAAQVSVVGASGSVRTNAEGRFTITPDPALPATLIIVGSRGELYPPVYLDSLRPQIQIQAAYRESVTVTTGAAPNIEGTPAAAPVVVGAEELEQHKPVHVVEAIAGTPGVSIRGEGPPAVPVIRGLAGGRTLLLIDDARIVTERRAGPSATFIDPLSLGSIEISRGPGSVAYGSDAIGGVVHLRPRDPTPGETMLRYDVWASFGGVAARSASLEATTDAFGGSLLASVHARSADDQRDGDGETIVNSQFRDRGALLRFVRDASWGRLRAGLMTSLARDVGAPAIGNDITFYPHERATLGTFAVDTQALGLFTSTALRASLGAHTLATRRERSSGIESTEVTARDASLRLSGERANDRTRLVAGADFVTRFDLRAIDSIEDASRVNSGLFVSWEQRLTPRAQVAAGARLDWVSTENRNGYFGDRSTSDVAPSGFVATTIGPFRDVTATFQIASGYREPSLSDRYFRGITGRGLITGNPDLEPERSLQFDAGVRWTGTRAHAALFFYDYRIRDLVERYRDGTDFFFRNRGEAEVRGMEAEYSRRLSQHFEIQLGAAIARGEAENEDPLDDIAPPSLHTSLRWAGMRSSAFLTGSAFARDDRPGPVEVERPGYVTIDAGAGYRFSPWFEVRVVIRNLTDVHRYGSPDENAAFAPGRSIMIGLNR